MHRRLIRAAWWLSLALALAPLTASPAAATGMGQILSGKQAPPPPRIVFKSAPHWEAVPGTNVYCVREAERPAYDLFRAGSLFYLFDQGHWYRSNRQERGYTVINERYVPVSISRVPSHHWRSYPQGWLNPKNPHYSGRHDNGQGASKSKGGKNH